MKSERCKFCTKICIRVKIPLRKVLLVTLRNVVT